MKVALVHDYLNEFGGAERVLLALSEIWPEAPIYTAFYREDSLAYARFKDRDIRPSFVQKIPGFASKLHSPLRFMAPLIWESMNFDEYDVVVSSASWYITKGIITRPETLHVCYCHTPPRYLYGYPTAMEWQKYWPIRMYANLINPGLRKYDYLAAQRVDEFLTNSKNTQGRIKKFYDRDAKVIYPPVDLPKPGKVKREDYYLVISRIVGGKGLELAVRAANRLRVPLKVVGVPAGWSSEYRDLQDAAGGTVEFLGYVDDQELSKLYAGARAFLALASDEDFGITPVEAMMHGTPVVAYKGGGYLETVVEGKTGIFFDEQTPESVAGAIEKLEKSYKKMSEKKIKEHAKKFGKARFKREIRNFVKKEYDKISRD